MRPVVSPTAAQSIDWPEYKALQLLCPHTIPTRSGVSRTCRQAEDQIYVNEPGTLNVVLVNLYEARVSLLRA